MLNYHSKYSLIVISLLITLLISGIASAEWFNSTGTDHDGAAWTPADASSISGIHYNISTFTITNGWTVNIDTGIELEVFADTIHVYGTLDGNGDGASGAGNGGTGGSDSSGAGGGGGAGYGGDGSVGKSGSYGGGGTAGPEFGDTTTKIISMGSKGGNGGTNSGGAGAGGMGGASVLLYGDAVIITGTITCDGNAGSQPGQGGGGGGGSGGGILIVGVDLEVTGTLSVDGGNGGNSGSDGDGAGGGGAGGRIKLVNSTSIDTTGITTSITGGTGGSGTTGVAGNGDVGTYNIFSTSPPSTPTAITPANNSDQGSTPVTLNVTSTDADGDSLQYYYYGDIVDGSTYLSDSSSYYDWSIGSDIYYWKARAYDGFMYGDYITVQSFTSFIPPILYAPINTSTTFTTFPPLTDSITFTWQDLSVSQYHLMVAEDIGFNIMSVDSHIGTNSSVHTLLVNKEYFWKVYSYDGVTYSDSSEIFRFNLTGNSTLTGSAIEGVVYQANGDINAISGAEVTIWNATWSSSMITGSNGYYVFKELESGTVYNLQAKSDRYWDSSIALVSAESDPVTNNFYLIDDLTDTEWWHYVEFTLQNVWGVTYPDVATKVYIGDSPTISDSGNTGADGTITFHMDQNVEYRITFIDTTLGIDEEVTLYPVATSYTVYIDSYSFDLPNTVTDDINAYITSSRLSATHGYINFTYSDTSGLTSSINYYIFDVDGNELYNTSNSGPDMSDSQIVEATDDRYIVQYVGVHPTHGIIDKTETVVFHGGRRVDFGWDSDWQYAVTALAFLIFIGSLFGAKTAHYGAITVVMFSFIFKWIGWLDETNTSTLLIILAAVIAFGWTLRKSEEVKM